MMNHTCAMVPKITSLQKPAGRKWARDHDAPNERIPA
jgi:hypothetical protein